MTDAPLINNVPEFTVTELSGSVKRMIEGAFGRVRVRGELGRVSLPRSGHVYLDLKDDGAVLGSVIWKGVASKLDFQPEEGLEVIAEGRLTTYPGQSKYQLVIERMEPAGTGALMALLERRKAALAAEGLFDESRKRPLPFLPQIIGVVTSPSGAVIRDILHRLEARFPCHVLVWPVAVQGEKCESEVAAAITGFNHLEQPGPIPRPDLIIVARGGGSVEDLWGFNGERVVRAVAASAIPVISAVGHETDWTLIDLAADRRAPTPTAAAEMAVPVRAELLAQTSTLDARRRSGLLRLIDQRRTLLKAALRGLPRPSELLLPPGQRVDQAGFALARSVEQRLERAQNRLTLAEARQQPLEFARRLMQQSVSLSAIAERLSLALSRNTARGRERLDRQAPALARWLCLQVLRRGQGLETLTARYHAARPDRLLQRAQERQNIAVRRLHDRAQFQLERRSGQLARWVTGLEAANPTAILARGYALIEDQDGALIRSAAEASGGAAARVRFHDGRREIIFGDGVEAKPKAVNKQSAVKQGDLF
jgi:exodeoxyribonuclease VII large subunit